MRQGNITSSLETRSANRSRLLAALRHHPLISYFVIAYAIAWGVSFPLILLVHIQVTLWLAIIVASGPTIASFIMTAVTEGRAGVGQLLRRYIRWRVGLIWYLIALLVFPALIVLITLLQPGGVAAVLKGLPDYPVTYVLVFFAGGPFLEEPGWRGFALPRLQKRLGPLPGSILLGILWGIWHLPLFLVPGYNGAGVGFVGISSALLAFTLTTALLATIFTWVYNNTRGSLLLVMLLHASFNTAGSLLPTDQVSLLGQIIMEAAFALIALIIIIATRGCLSYDRCSKTNVLPTDHAASDTVA